MINKHEVSELLPGYNCGICGYARCEEFAGPFLKSISLLKNVVFYYKKYMPKT